jgi:hypothetical protein
MVSNLKEHLYEDILFLTSLEPQVNFVANMLKQKFGFHKNLVKLSHNIFQQVTTPITTLIYNDDNKGLYKLIELLLAPNLLCDRNFDDDIKKTKLI